MPQFPLLEMEKSSLTTRLREGSVGSGRHRHGAESASGVRTSATLLPQQQEASGGCKGGSEEAFLPPQSCLKPTALAPGEDRAEVISSSCLLGSQTAAELDPEDITIP